MESKAPKTPTKHLKVELGQFYTAANPFVHPRVLRWIEERGSSGRWLEPFAGANHIVTMIDTTAGARHWQSFDIEPGAQGVKKRDVLAKFPKGFDVIATNPPYLARNSARRRGYTKALEVMGKWEDLYLRCLEECLENVGHVAAIIPESFIGSGYFRERLRFVVSLTQEMFADTEHPVCLAVFGPEPGVDFEVWSGSTEIGMWSAISAHELSAKRSGGEKRRVMRFNDKRGRIGLLAVDGTKKASIRFTQSSEVAVGEIKPSSRHKTRIHVPSLRDADDGMLGEVIAEANSILSGWRKKTGDVLMSPFMGLRGDGLYRRRLDYTNAAKILGQAVDRCEKRRQRNKMNEPRGGKRTTRHSPKRTSRRG